MKVTADMNSEVATCREIMHLDKEVVPIKQGYELEKQKETTQKSKQIKNPIEDVRITKQKSPTPAIA